MRYKIYIQFNYNTKERNDKTTLVTYRKEKQLFEIVDKLQWRD